MAKVSLEEALIKRAYYDKIIKEFQNKARAMEVAAKKKRRQINARQKREQAAIARANLLLKGKQEQALSRLTTSQLTKFNIKSAAVQLYKSANVGKSQEWKLEHKKMYKTVEIAVNGGSVTNYGNLEKERHSYLMRMLNKAEASGMSVEAKAAAVEWVPKYKKSGQPHKGEDLSDTAYFKRAKTWTKRLARNLEHGLGSKKWDAFTDKMIRGQHMGTKRAKELKGVKSKKAFFNFLISQDEYEKLGSTFVKLWNKTTSDFRQKHGYFWTNPSHNKKTVARRHTMMQRNIDQKEVDQAEVDLSELAYIWK